MIRRNALRLMRKGRSTYNWFKNRCIYEKRRRTAPAVEIGNREDVLVITVDCLRDDRLSRRGHARETTPFLDRVGDHVPAITAAPWTYSSVPSILSGLYPHNHGAVYPDEAARNQDLSNPPNKMVGDIHTLAEILARDGYQTRFATAIRTAALPIPGRFGSVEINHDADAETLLSDVGTWWQKTSSPKFAYVQLGDLHEPLHRPAERPFGEVPDVDCVSRWRFERSTIPSDEFEEYKRARSLLYDTVLRRVDEAIEGFFADIDGDPLVVITSDHGEELWEYRDFEKERFEDPRDIYGVGHGHALVPSVLEVPIISNCDLSRQSSRGSTTDIVPTILDRLRVNYGFDLDGRSLFRDGSRPVLSQEIAYGPNQISVTADDDHLIYIPDRDETILLDFITWEQKANPERVRELFEHVPQERRIGNNIRLSAEVKSQLSDLGYR